MVLSVAVSIPSIVHVFDYYGNSKPNEIRLF
jgi:hypothetical protein